MSDDPLDQLSSRLFKAMRDEPAPSGAEQRALEAALREVGAARAEGARTRFMLLAAALACIALSLVVVASRERAVVSIAAERPSSTNHGPSRSPAASTPTLARPAPTQVSSALGSAKPVAAAPERPVSAPAPTLADELEALRVAERSLSAADPSGALKALDRYDRVLKGQKLQAEATLLRIEALAKAGQSRAAAELAARFAQQNPNSPLVDRARSFIGEAGLGGSEHE